MSYQKKFNPKPHQISHVIHLIHNVWYEESTDVDEELGIISRYHALGTDNNALISGLISQEGKPEIYVVFRGTENTKNVLSHIFGWPRAKVSRNRPYKVHRGWWENYKSLRSWLYSSLLKRNLLDKTLIFAGHSMGAALAGIAALDVGETFKVEPNLILLACPKFVNRAGSEKLSPRTFSVINGSDYITHLYPGFTRPDTVFIGTPRLLPSFKDHLPWDEKGHVGYVNAIKDFFRLTFPSPW